MAILIAYVHISQFVRSSFSGPQTKHSHWEGLFQSDIWEPALAYIDSFVSIYKHSEN